MDSLGDGKRGKTPNYNPVQCIQFSGRDLIRPREDQMAGAGQSGEWLAQRTAWEKGIPFRRSCGIDQHDVEVAVKAAVLKAVVEQKELAFQLMDGAFRGGNAIGILEMRHIWEAFLQQQSLVVAGVQTAITPAQNGHSYVPLAIIAGNIFNAGSFSRSAHTQVTHTDNRHGRRVNGKPAVIVEPIPKSNSSTVRPTGDPEQSTSQACFESGLAAENDFPPGVFPTLLPVFHPVPLSSLGRAL
jgi:hypothetical protein